MTPLPLCAETTIPKNSWFLDVTPAKHDWPKATQTSARTSSTMCVCGRAEAAGLAASTATTASAPRRAARDFTTGSFYISRSPRPFEEVAFQAVGRA